MHQRPASEDIVEIHTDPQANSPLLSRKKPMASSIAFKVAATNCTDASSIASSVGKVARNRSISLNFFSKSTLSRPVVILSRTCDVVSKA